MKKMILLLTAALMLIVFAATVNAGAVEDTHSDLNVEVKPQTCMEDGSRTRRCRICNEVVDITYIVAKRHSELYDKTTASTCTIAGKEARHCMLCNIEVDYKTLPLADHNWGEWEVTTKATCEKAGAQKHTCAVCKIVATEVIPRLGGNCDWFKQATPTPATCTEHSYWYSYCKKCGDTKKEYINPETPLPGHDIDKTGATGTRVPATGKTDGYRLLKCSVCKENVKYWEHELKYCGDAHIPAGPGFWEWNLIRSIIPTCVIDGSNTYECNVCSREKTEVEKAKGHVPEIQEDGTIKCKVCEVTYVPSK